MAAASPDFTLDPSEPAPESRSPSVLNRQSLIERCLGNQELAERVLDKLRESLVEELVRLRAAISDSDLSRVKEIAHRLRGTAANAGAETLCQAAEQLELMARRGDKAAAVQAIYVLEANIRRVLELIENELGV